MPTLDEYRQILQIFQSARLRRDYSDLAAQPQYYSVSDFFFTQMYGPHDFTERDAGARRLHHFIHLVPGVRLRDVEEAVELLELTSKLDDDVARWLQALNAPFDFDEPTYECAYFQADNYEQRLYQLNLVHATLLNMHRLTNIPFLGFALRQARFVALMSGMEALHTFMVEGHTALLPVQNIRYFADTVYERELQRLNRIYASDLE
ncbi:MAG: hypothetical protein MI924_29085 [Chloroflexales bacterium]|nr:hypothetical protein [Chloroflexales bacterium]